MYLNINRHQCCDGCRIRWLLESIMILSLDYFLCPHEEDPTNPVELIRRDRITASGGEVSQLNVGGGVERFHVGMERAISVFTHGFLHKLLEESRKLENHATKAEEIGQEQIEFP
ncbi:uncharacterized protein LOC117922577 isoform X2 [Vitis riparia]|uniref:uncharacterized protein LOC117922577 isoform X2 n=1 Tax=Vitis riparia TaxID=96939 RepID=UPI00155AB562|nr:uncharacterized protein LOC117922577 isoform X2 [Vitis riparia]